jgi:1,2-phenylacetyl-CoA epoxidase PaaB subunit
MNLTQLTNPHIAATAPAESRVDPAAPMRTRRVTLSPAEEYQARPGETELIPDALAALILSRKAFVEVGSKGVTLNRKELGGKRRYWHPDSPLCNHIGKAEKRKIIAVWNDLDPSCIHLMSVEGRYLETLPAETMPAMLDNEALSKELAAHRRVHARHHEHLRRLHAEDSLAALESARNNTTEIQRAVTIMPAEATGQRDAAPSDLAASVESGDRRIKAGQATHAAHRREADASFNLPRPRQQTPSETILDPFDIA